MEQLRIIDIIGSPNAIIHNFGIQVFEALKPFLTSGHQISLSFEGLRNVTSGFCNASIGKAYLEFKNADELILITGADKNPIWQEKIKDAINLATNPDKTRLQNQAISELLCS